MTNYKIQNILVPFDFSNSVLNALRVADKFAYEFKARIHLLSIIEPPVSIGSPRFSNNIQSYFPDYTSAMEKYICKHFNNPGSYFYKTCFGFYCSSVEKEVDSNKYDLIILPDDTKGFFSRFFSKFKPLKIMELTKIPVIAVNKYYKTAELQNIIVPIRNVSNWYEKIPFMISLVKQTGGKIHVVGLNEHKTSFSSEFKCIFDEAVSILERENVLGTIKTLKGDDCLNELILYSEKHNGGLIALTPTRQRAIQSLIYPSLYNRIISRSPAPIFGVQLS